MIYHKSFNIVQSAAYKSIIQLLNKQEKIQMKKFAFGIVMLCSVCVLPQAQAEIRFYGLLDLAINDWQVAGEDSSAGFSIGGGVKIHDFVSLELAYNDLGDTTFNELNDDEVNLDISELDGLAFDLTNVDLSAYSYSLSGNFGISFGSVRPFLVIGVEELNMRAEGIIKNGLETPKVNEDNSEVEGVFGIGIDLFSSEDNTINGRIKLTTHGDGSDDIYRLTLGFAIGS